MRLFFISILTAVFTTLSASSAIGVIVKVEGVVKVKSEDSIKSNSIKVGTEIKKGDLVTTLKNSNAVIKLTDHSILVLDTSSAVIFAADTNIEQKVGKIYYKIRHNEKIETE